MLVGGGYKSWVEEGSDRGEEEGQRGRRRGVRKGGGGEKRGEEEWAAKLGRRAV